MAFIDIEALKTTARASYIAFGVCGAAIFIFGIVTVANCSYYSEIYSPFKGIFITAIVIGAATLLVVELGPYGVTKGSLLMLILFVASLCALFIFHLVLVVMSGAGLRHTGSTIKEEMYKSLVNYKTKEKSESFWDYFQDLKECCGVENASDWTANGLLIPYSCCNENSAQKEDLCAGNNGHLYIGGCKVPFQYTLKVHFSVLTGMLVFNIIVMPIYVVFSVYLIWKIKQRAF